MPAGYQFQVVSIYFPNPDQKDAEKEIKRLGFNRQAQAYRSLGNFEVKKW